MYLTCLSCDSPVPLLSRVETDPEIFEQILRKRKTFETLVRTHSLRVSKSDLIHVPADASTASLSSDIRDSSTPTGSRFVELLYKYKTIYFIIFYNVF